MAEEPSAAAAAVAGAVDHEVQLLTKEIRRVSGGASSVTYGELATDTAVEGTFEALLGTLKAARKRGVVTFEGELLLLGQHDHVVISIVEDKAAAPAQPAAAEAKAAELAEEPAKPAAVPEPAVEAPADAEPTEPEEVAAETAVEEEPVAPVAPPATAPPAMPPPEEEPAAPASPPSAAVPPPTETPPPAPKAETKAEEPAAPEPAAQVSEERNSGSGKWNVDTSYIDHRTADPNRLEGRRTDIPESTPADALTNAVAAAHVAGSSAATKGEDGKWNQVDVSYINHRTGEVDNLEPRRGGSAGAAAAVPAAVAPGPSSTVKKEDGKWTVDTSYINHRTGDPANLTRNLEAAEESKYADPLVKKYPYEEIKGLRPSDVDPAKKELYLADDEFKTVMGMTLLEYQKMPKWKQQNLKKAKDIF